jgi:hypothetical protein
METSRWRAIFRLATTSVRKPASCAGKLLFKDANRLIFDHKNPLTLPLLP